MSEFISQLKNTFRLSKGTHHFYKKTSVYERYRRSSSTSGQLLLKGDQNTQVESTSKKSSFFLSQASPTKPKINISSFCCPGGLTCPNYMEILALKKKIQMLMKSNEQLGKLVHIYKNGMSQKTRLFQDYVSGKESLKHIGKSVVIKETNFQTDSKTENNLLAPHPAPETPKKISENDSMIKKVEPTKEESPRTAEKDLKRGFPKRAYTLTFLKSSKNLLRPTLSQITGSQKDTYYNVLTTNKNASSHYDLIDDFSERFFKYKYHNNSAFSFLAQNKGYKALVEENTYISTLAQITKSDKIFIQRMEEASTDELISYSDSISALIKDYKMIMRLNFRMKDFIKGSISLVDSVVNRNSEGVLISNTCHILDCERASLFIYDKVTDMLVVHSGEGIRKCQIKVPKDKGIVGAVFMSGEKLKIDDVYLDNRFNKEIDKKTNFKTRNIMCYPLKDKYGETFGCIQAINKRNKSFDCDDEELLRFFSQQASAILKNMMNMDDNILQIYRLQYLLQYNIECNKVNNLCDFTARTEDVLLNIFTCLNSQFLHFKKGKLLHYISQEEVKKIPDLGIISMVKKKKEINRCGSIKKSAEYNYITDLETQDGLLTFPVIDQGQFYGVAQVPYSGKVDQDDKLKDNELFIMELFSKCVGEWYRNNHL